VHPAVSFLSVSVTAHFAERRLKYLREVLSALPDLARRVRVQIFTNTHEHHEQELIKGSIPQGLDAKLYVPELLGHPYLLPWCHFEIFRKQLDAGEVSHFLYIEDDLLITPENVAYWIDGRDKLASLGIIPSFLRFEEAVGGIPVATDVTSRLRLSGLPRVKTQDGSLYCNLPQPYQGMYLLDRALAAEHFLGATSSPDHAVGGIRESAALGVTFGHIPNGCHSRNFLKINLEKNTLDSGALVKHLANNYANTSASGSGSIPLNELIKIDCAVATTGTISLPWKSRFDLLLRRKRRRSI
jgi:hypothetical protein